MVPVPVPHIRRKEEDLCKEPAARREHRYIAGSAFVSRDHCKTILYSGLVLLNVLVPLPVVVLEVVEQQLFTK